MDLHLATVMPADLQSVETTFEGPSAAGYVGMAVFATLVFFSVRAHLRQKRQLRDATSVQTVAGGILIGRVFLIGVVLAVIALFFSSDTKKAERMIQERLSATNVTCEQKGDVLGVKGWDCHGRDKYGTDNVQFWAEKFQDGQMNVGQGWITR